MRRIMTLLAVCLLFVLSGCRGGVPDDNAAANTSTADAPTVTVLPDSPDQPETTPPPEGTAESTEQASNRIAGDVVEITEKLFIAQTNDIYLNYEDYIGKTIKYEGLFTQYTWEEADMTYYLVYRKSPGCCGADGQAGFEVIWPDDSDNTYPNENDWVEVVGRLESYEELGQSYLRISLDSLTVKSERGADFVSQ